MAARVSRRATLAGAAGVPLLAGCGGSVATGPATRPLPSVAVEEKDGQVVRA